MKQFSEYFSGRASAEECGIAPKSIHRAFSEDGTDFIVALGRENGREVILCYGNGCCGFSGEEIPAEKKLIKAEESFENCSVLRRLFPFCAPCRVLGRTKTFGVGDRLGIAGDGHLSLFAKHPDVTPVLAQQSIRELNLTGRKYEDVLDSASLAVFRNDYRGGFGADGDHLKTREEVTYALGLGFSMLTLDCSEHIKASAASAELETLPPIPGEYASLYLGKSFEIGEVDGKPAVVTFDEESLRRACEVYGEMLSFAADIYAEFLADGKYGCDFEISIDEVAAPTKPTEHYFVAAELLRRGVRFATLAPRFCGEFQKGIDYIGDLGQFEEELKIHCAIAKKLGYKLSIHSGSDKFSVFPLIGKYTEGVWHVKTAGTNYLEAMRIVAECDPALYREVHAYALAHFSEATKYYHVTTDLSRIPQLSSLSDDELPGLFAHNDARQLIHICYGLLLTAENEKGEPLFRDRLYRLWDENREKYAAALEKHIGRHLSLLGV